MTETGGRIPDITAQLGGHLDDQREQTLLHVCESAMARTVDLHHLAYYTDRVLDFTLDVLEDENRAPRHAVTAARPGLQRLGRQLCGEFETLDDRLRQAQTGALIRTVLRTDDAEIVCDPVVRAQFVVGVSYTEAHDYIDESNSVDRSLADLVRSLRTHVGLQSQNVGGYETDTAPTPTPTEDSRRIEPHIDAHIDARTDPHHDTIPATVEQACLAALNPHGLHLVACCVDDEIVFLADIFDHSTLALFFAGPVTPRYRRGFYRELGGQLAEIRSRLARVSARMLRGPLKRVVLDVEQGAVYYFRVTSRTYLVGVTLNQTRVRQTDLRMAELAEECGKLHPAE
ncbi:hypothetical protein [Actinophytocola sediminis]